MDIRNVKRPMGTQKPTTVAEEPKTSVTPPFETDGASMEQPFIKYDSVVIGQYMAYLKENGITEEDIFAILDKLITDGNVYYDTVILGKIPVRFCVRAAWVNDLIMEKLDEATQGSDKVSVMRFNNLIALYNLAASLVRYGDKSFTVNNEAEFSAALERVKGMSYIIQNALVNALALFDRAIAVATSDWAVKNFTEPQKGE